MATKAKTGKGRKTASKEPTIYTERGQRLPAVDVRTPPLYFRLPLKLRSPNTSNRRAGIPLYQPIYDAAFEKVQQDWWDKYPASLAERYLSSAFSGQLAPEQSGVTSGFMTVRGIGSPSQWTPAQHQAWLEYEEAARRSVDDAEKDYHKEIEQRLKAQRAEEKRRKERERVEREAAIEEEGEQARKDEWDALVKEGTWQYWRQQGVSKSMPINPNPEQAAAAHQFGQEWAALQEAFLGPSKAPEVQKHLRKLRQEVATRRAREPGRLPGVEVGDWQRPPGAEPLELAEEERKRQRKEAESNFFGELAYKPKFGAKLSKAQIARERAIEKLRGQLSLAIVPKERRSILARLKRIEAVARKKSPPLPKRQLKQQRKRQWKEVERFRLLSPTSSVGRTSAQPKSRGRYSSPVTIETPIRVPFDVAQRVDEQARAQALARLPPMPADDDYNMIGTREWRRQFNATYAPIRQALWEEAIAALGAERQAAKQRARYLESDDSRFANLEIGSPARTLGEPVLVPDTRFEQLEVVDPTVPTDDVVRDRFQDWYR